MQKTIEIQKMKSLVKQQVVESLREILNDPDFGLDLTASAARRLRKSISSGNKGLYKPLEEIMKKYA